MRKEKIFLAVLLVLFCNITYGQAARNFAYEKVKDSIFKDAYDLTNVLPSKFLDGHKQDVTSYLQKALDKHKSVIMPNFPVFVSDEGLKISSGHKILFQPKSKIRLLSSKKERYAILDITRVHDVEVYFPNIEGERNNHMGSTGQWGHGIYITSSENILVVSPYITDTWGDGICIGGRNGIPSKRISILGGTIKNTRRNGISVVSGRNVTIDSVYIENANGQNPQSGIDIEPDSHYNELHNIVLSNITTVNNKLHGIVISIGSLAGKKQKRVSIKIQNHKDIGSVLGLGLFLSRNDSRLYNNIVGTIDIDNINYYDNKIFVRNYTTFKTGVKTHLGVYNFKRDGQKVLFDGQKERFLNRVEKKHRSIR